MPDTTALTRSDAMSQMLGFRFVSVKELPEEEKQVLKNTVAKGTTDDELSYFLNVSFAQELNPFQKEVWCVKYNTSLMIQTSRDGFLKIAKRDPTFDRIQSAEVREGDEFRMDPITGQVEHRFTAKRGQIIGAYAIITRKDGTKLAKYITFSEYVDQSSNIWRDYPSAMACKCAESVLCKQFANVTGITAEETIRRDGTVIDSSPTAQAQQLSMKEQLIAQIDACKDMEQFDKLRDGIAGATGKLFDTEKQEVFAAAKRKKAELETLDVRPDMSDKVIDHKDGDPTNNEISNLSVVDAEIVPPVEMAAEEFSSWLEGIANQETAEGVRDVLTAAMEKPMSDAQRDQLAVAGEKATAELQKEEKRTKKKSPPAA